MKKLFSFSAASALALYLILGLVCLGEAAGKPKPPPAPPVNPVIVYVVVSSSGPYNELAVANADGSNQRALLSSDQVGYFSPAWSPDFDLSTPGFQGSVIFEESNEWRALMVDPTINLKVIDVVVSSAGVTATNERNLELNASSAAWSPRGDKIAYVKHEAVPNVIHIRDLVTNVTLSIADPGNTRNAGWPAWNPAGTHLAYTWDDNNQGEFSIRITEVVDENTNQFVSSGDDREISSSVYAASALDWSRSDNFLAFKAAGAMQIVNVNSLQMETLPNTTSAESPTWMPANETELVFMTRNGPSGAGKRKIVKRHLITNVETVIVERTGYHLYEPDWRR